MQAKEIILNVIRKKETVLLIVFLLFCFVVSLIAPRFLSAQNLYVLSRQVSLIAFVAIGVFFPILTGGIDLSVGSIMGLSGVICGLILAKNSNIPLAVISGIASGTAAGLISGYFVAYIGLSPFIPTLAMLSIARGIVLIITKGWPITDIPEKFFYLGSGSIFGIPVCVVILIFFAIVCFILTKLTIFGRQIYAIGGNERASFLSGIKVKLYKFLVYGISGFFAALTGVIMVGRFCSAQAGMGEGWELDAIASAVIGGASLSGGAGSIMGVLIGASIMGVIRNALVLMKVSAYWQQLVIGLIILLAATIDRVGEMKRN